MSDPELRSALKDVCQALWTDAMTLFDVLEAGGPLTVEDAKTVQRIRGAAEDVKLGMMGLAVSQSERTLRHAR